MPVIETGRRHRPSSRQARAANRLTPLKSLPAVLVTYVARVWILVVERPVAVRVLVTSCEEMDNSLIRLSGVADLAQKPVLGLRERDGVAEVVAGRGGAFDLRAETQRDRQAGGVIFRRNDLDPDDRRASDLASMLDECARLVALVWADMFVLMTITETPSMSHPLRGVYSTTSMPWVNFNRAFTVFPVGTTGSQPPLSFDNQSYRPPP